MGYTEMITIKGDFMKSLRFFLFTSILVLGFIGCDSSSGGSAGGGNNIVNHTPSIESLKGTWIWNEESTLYLTYDDGTVELLDSQEINSSITITKTGDNSATYNQLFTNFIDYETIDDKTLCSEEEGLLSFDEDGYLVRTQIRIRSSDSEESIDTAIWEPARNTYKEKVIIVDSVLYYGPYELVSGDSDLTGNCVYKNSFNYSIVEDDSSYDYNNTTTLEFKESEITFHYDRDCSDDEEDSYITEGPWEYTVDGNTLSYSNQYDRVHNYTFIKSGSYLLLHNSDKKSNTRHGWIRE